MTKIFCYCNLCPGYKYAPISSKPSFRSREEWRDHLERIHGEYENTTRADGIQYTYEYEGEKYYLRNYHE